MLTKESSRTVRAIKPLLDPSVRAYCRRIWPCRLEPRVSPATGSGTKTRVAEPHTRPVAHPLQHVAKLGEIRRYCSTECPACWSPAGSVACRANRHRAAKAPDPAGPLKGHTLLRFCC